MIGEPCRIDANLPFDLRLIATLEPIGEGNLRELRIKSAALSEYLRNGRHTEQRDQHRPSHTPLR